MIHLPRYLKYASVQISKPVFSVGFWFWMAIVLVFVFEGFWRLFVSDALSKGLQVAYTHSKNLFFREKTLNWVPWARNKGGEVTRVICHFKTLIGVSKTGNVGTSKRFNCKLLRDTWKYQPVLVDCARCKTACFSQCYVFPVFCFRKSYFTFSEEW